MPHLEMSTWCLSGHHGPKPKIPNFVLSQYSGTGQLGPVTNKIKRNLIYLDSNDNNIEYAAGGAAWAVYNCILWWLASPGCIVLKCLKHIWALTLTFGPWWPKRHQVGLKCFSYNHSLKSPLHCTIYKCHYLQHRVVVELVDVICEQRLK